MGSNRIQAFGSLGHNVWSPVPGLPKLPNSKTYAADWREHVPARTSVRQKRAGADELLEQLDHFRLAGNFSDRPFVIFVYGRATSPMGRPSTTGEKVLA